MTIPNSNTLLNYVAEDLKDCQLNTRLRIHAVASQLLKYLIFPQVPCLRRRRLFLLTSNDGLISGLELSEFFFIHPTSKKPTLYINIEKLDTTGYDRHSNSEPSTASPSRALIKGYLRYAAANITFTIPMLQLLFNEEKKELTAEFLYPEKWLYLFAISKQTYLFPTKDDQPPPAKHICNDIVKWWKRTLSIVTEKNPNEKMPSFWQVAMVYIPGEEDRSRTVEKIQGVEWKFGYTESPQQPAITNLPLFEDDVRTRLLQKNGFDKNMTTKGLYEYTATTSECRHRTGFFSLKFQTAPGSTEPVSNNEKEVTEKVYLSIISKLMQQDFLNSEAIQLSTKNVLSALSDLEISSLEMIPAHTNKVGSRLGDPTTTNEKRPCVNVLTPTLIKRKKKNS